MKYIDAKADLPGQLPLVNRKATIITFLLLLLLALLFVENRIQRVKQIDVQKEFQVEDVPITKQKVKEPPKPKPVLAEVIEAEEDEEVDETIEIAQTVELDSFVPEPVVEDEDVYDFFAIEEGAEVLEQVAPEYPEIAKKAGMEGVVMVEVIIGKNGKVESAQVVGVRGPEGYFEESALKAAKKFVFSPAMQRDKAVRVKKQIPFVFKVE